MVEILKKITENLNKDNLDKAYDLCEKNLEKKIEHIISNIKGVILFKKQKFKSAESEFFKSLFKNCFTSLSIIFFGVTPNFFAFSLTNNWLPNLLSIDIKFNFGLNLRASRPIVPLPDPISNKVPNSGNSKSASI